MALPIELREQIWSYTLTSPFPIIAYVEERTAPRPPIEDSRFPLAQTRRESRPQPPLPALAFLAPEISRETLRIYYGANTFVFNLTLRDRDEVSRWMILLQRDAWCATWPWKDPDDSDEELADEDLVLLWQYLTVRLEFDVNGINSITDRSRVLMPAWVEYNRVKDERVLDIRFGGQLERECCCWLLEGVATVLGEYDNRWSVGGGYNIEDDPVLQRFAIVVEKMAREVWRDTWRMGYMDSTCCGKCGKELYQAVGISKKRDQAFEAPLGDMKRSLRI